MLRKILFFNVFFCILHHFKHLRTIYLLTYFMEFDFEDGLIAEDEVLKRQMEDQALYLRQLLGHPVNIQLCVGIMFLEIV